VLSRRIKAIENTGAIVFAVPPGFAAALRAQPSELTGGQLDPFTGARRLSLGPEDPSVSSSRVIFDGPQVGAHTIPRSLRL
jgi:hypothetical protein